MNRRPPAPLLLQDLRVLEIAGPRVRLASRFVSAEICALTHDLFRLVVMPRGTTPPPSWAVTKTDWPAPDVTIRKTASHLTVATDSAQFRIRLATGAWTLTDRHDLLVFSARAGATGFSGTEAGVTLDLVEREALFGLGESTGPLDKRGLVREFWNIDVLGHAPAIHPGLRSQYVAIPFAISLRDGRAAGFFWDNPAHHTWDLGATDRDSCRMSAAHGAIDLHLFSGPGVDHVVQRFTELTGRMPLPPRWALGYHQSRYSYASRAELESVAREFRRRKIPCDALHADIHHMDGYRVFTFGKTYPNPAPMLAKLGSAGFKVVTIVDPGVKDDPRFGVLKRGRRAKAFVKDATGRKDFLGEAWPGRIRFPDFLNAETRQWWGAEQQALLDLGVAGVWNDMNEPANFARPDKSLDPKCVHRTDHGCHPHEAVHNVYGQQMARASFEGALASGMARPFVLTRAGYAGIQRFAAVWTGDNSSCWEHLGDALRQILGLGLGGVAFAGADVGGFLDHATPELFVRWLQMAVFTPFLRNHSNINTRRQEPWAFGPEVEAIARQYIQLRYQLLPFLYSLFARAAKDGTPIVRPMFWHHPNDPVAAACQDQFFLGDGLLVAPILQPGALARSVYLPRGEWFDFWTGVKYPGGIHLCADAPLDKIPLFVRAGSILPMTENRPFVGPREPGTVLLHVWPDDHGHLDWYDDDGHTSGWQHGLFQRRTITSRHTARGGSLHLGAPEGPYPGDTRTWRIILRSLRRKPRVFLGRKSVPAEFVPELGLASFDLPSITQALEVRWR